MQNRQARGVCCLPGALDQPSGWAGRREAPRPLCSSSCGSFVWPVLASGAQAPTSASTPCWKAWRRRTRWTSTATSSSSGGRGAWWCRWRYAPGTVLTFSFRLKPFFMVGVVTLKAMQVVLNLKQLLSVSWKLKHRSQLEAFCIGGWEHLWNKDDYKVYVKK